MKRKLSWQYFLACAVFHVPTCFSHLETEAESPRQPGEWKSELRYWKEPGPQMTSRMSSGACLSLTFIFPWNTKEHFSFWSHRYLFCSLLAVGCNSQPIPDFHSEFAGESWCVKYLLWKRWFTTYFFFPAWARLQWILKPYVHNQNFIFSMHHMDQCI